VKLFVAALVIALSPGLLCSAQDLPSTTGQDSDQSVAAAAMATRRPKMDPVKEADIRQLLQVTNAAGIAAQSMGQMEKIIRPSVSRSLPPGEYREKLVDLFFEKFRARRTPDQLVDLIVPIYDKYYSDDEIKGLIQLYQTPLGKKMLTVLPNVMGESQAAGAAWGRDLGRQCLLEVLAEHPDLAKALQDAKNNPQPQ
jgi:uncharacterized protein